MAFDKGNMNKALEEAKSPEFNTRNSSIIKPNKREKKQRYQFTLEPSVRKKIRMVAEENGYSSSSEFLNELVKNI